MPGCEAKGSAVTGLHLVCQTSAHGSRPNRAVRPRSMWRRRGAGSPGWRLGFGCGTAQPTNPYQLVLTPRTARVAAVAIRFKWGL